MRNKIREGCPHFDFRDLKCHWLDHKNHDISALSDKCPHKESLIIESMSGFQQENRENDEPKEEKKMDLKVMLDFWQKRLGLLDWKIVLKENCLPEDFTIEDSKGEVEYNTILRSAVIRILNPVCYSEDRILPFDLQQVMVHELLHLKFAMLDGMAGELGDKVMHQLIDELATVLTGQSIYERNKY